MSRQRRMIALAAALMLLASTSAAQRGFFRRYDFAKQDSFDGAFQFCRVWFRGAANGDGADWQVDFPRADSNLMTRASELTKTPISRLPDGEPNHLIIRLTQPEL